MAAEVLTPVTATHPPVTRANEVPPLERLLVVGLGSIGQRHARVVRQLVPGVRIAAWRHRPSSDAPRAGIDAEVATVEEALAFRPQAAVIASPATHHLAAANALVAAGVPLLIEKPIAASAAGVDALLASAARAGVPVMVGYNLRFLPSLQRFRALLAEGIVGTVMSVRAEAGQSLLGWRPGTDYRESVSARAALGGGVLLELSHEFDYLRWLFGDVEWVQAVVRRQSALEIDVEDTAHVVLGFAARGAGAPLVASVSLDFIRQDSTRSCTAIGSTGTLRWNGIASTVELYRSETGWETVATLPTERDTTYLAEWEHFLSCVATGASPCVTGHDGLAAVRVVDAARASSAEGRQMPVVRA